MVEKNFVKGYPVFLRTDSVGTYGTQVFDPPSDQLRAIINHWAIPSDGNPATFVERNPAPTPGNYSPFEAGTVAHVEQYNPFGVTKGVTEDPNGFIPTQTGGTYRMSSIDGGPPADYETDLNNYATGLYPILTPPGEPAVTIFKSPPNFILPHDHVAFLDADGNGYTISTTYSSQAIKELATDTFPDEAAFLSSLKSTVHAWTELEKVPHELPHHMHRVVNYKVEETTTVVPVDFEFDMDDKRTGEYMYELQKHGHNVPLAADGSGTEDEGERGIIKETQTGYVSLCGGSLGFIESFKLKMNGEAFIEEGIVVQNNELSIMVDTDNLIKNGGVFSPEDKEKIADYWEVVTPRIRSALWNKTDKWLREVIFPTANDEFLYGTNHYFDHTFKSYYPTINTTTGDATGVISLDFKYNYNQMRYEKAVEKLLGTYLLPNLNLFAFLKAHPKILNDHGSRFKHILQLASGGDVKIPAKDINLQDFFSFNEYLKLWSYAVENRSDILSPMYSVAKHVLYDHSGEPIRNSFNDRKGLFPMYTEMTFQTSPLQSTATDVTLSSNRIFTDFFADLENKGQFEEKNDNYAIRWLMEKMVDDIEGGIVVHPVTGQETEVLYGLFDVDFSKQDGLANSKRDHKTWDLTPYIAFPCVPLQMETLAPEIQHKIDNALILTSDMVFDALGSGADSNETNLNVQLYANIFSDGEGTNPYLAPKSILKASHAVSAEQFRPMGAVYNSTKNAYSELMFFKIEKIDAGNNTVLQTYYIPRPLENSLINFIDTQIKYGDQYKYKVKAYVLVTGNDYQYLGHINKLYENYKIMSIEDHATAGGPTPEIWFGEDRFRHSWFGGKEQGAVYQFGHAAEFAVINRPSVHLMELDYISFSTISVVDDPPMPPDVEIIPFKGVKDKMLFWLNQTFGETTAKPIVILPGDEEKFALNWLKHSNDPSVQTIEVFGLEHILAWVDFMGGEIPPLLFKTDDYVKQFQVFRIDKKPASYEDFATGLREPELDLKQNSFIDTLEPNTKYYYIFRAVDIHGNISNPTPVYEVELVSNSGASYPITKIVDFESPIPQVKEKQMRRFVHIIPSFAQSKMNLNADDWDDVYSPNYYPSFGDAFNEPDVEKPRKFKIRFTSKSTGRKFDLNLKMVHKEDNDARWQNHLKKIEQEGLMSLDDESLKNYET